MSHGRHTARPSCASDRRPRPAPSAVPCAMKRLGSFVRHWTPWHLLRFGPPRTRCSSPSSCRGRGGTRPDGPSGSSLARQRARVRTASAIVSRTTASDRHRGHRHRYENPHLYRRDAGAATHPGGRLQLSSPRSPEHVIEAAYFSTNHPSVRPTRTCAPARRVFPCAQGEVRPRTPGPCPQPPGLLLVEPHSSAFGTGSVGRRSTRPLAGRPDWRELQISTLSSLGWQPLHVQRASRSRPPRGMKAAGHDLGRAYR